jgi:hypothetical protein
MIAKRPTTAKVERSQWQRQERGAESGAVVSSLQLSLSLALVVLLSLSVLRLTTLGLDILVVSVGVSNNASIPHSLLYAILIMLFLLLLF